MENLHSLSSSSAPLTSDVDVADAGQRRRWLEHIVPLVLFLGLAPFLYKIYILLPTRSWEQLQRPEFQLEILAAVVVILQFLQWPLCRERFQRNHWLVQRASWAAYYGPVPLAACAVGLMLKLPRCPYWLVGIFVAAGYSDTMAAYSLEEDKQNVRGFAKQALSLAYLIVALVQGAPLQRPAEMLSLVLGFLVFWVHLVISSWATIPSVDLCTVAAEHVRLQGQASSTTLKEEGDQQAARRIVVAVGSRRNYQGAVSGCTTYLDILRLTCPSAMKDVCLSSALFIQLLQRYVTPGVDRSSVNRLFHKLLADPESPEHAARTCFKLVEVQLAFLYDYFFSWRGSPSRTSYGLYTVYYFLKISFLFSVFRLVYYPIDENTDKAELMTNFYPSLIALVSLELCHLVDYLTSNWLLVSYMCACARDSWHIKVISSLLWKLGSELEIVGSEARGWQNKLGQYSLVEVVCRSSSLRQQRLRMARLLPAPPQGGTTLASPVALSDRVKTWVVDKARSDGFTSRMESGFPDGRAWKLVQGSESRTILTWHIATWYCEMGENVASPGTNGVASLPGFRVAKELSRYCAYLVMFQPELLPWQHAGTRQILDEAVADAAELNMEGGSSAMQDWYTKLEAWDLKGPRDQGILRLGVRLGRRLKDMADSSPKRWKIMADFWAETLLFMAQLDNAAAHIERLARGGEFVTHLWALLSNAGIQPECPFIKQNN